MAQVTILVLGFVTTVILRTGTYLPLVSVYAKRVSNSIGTARHVRQVMPIVTYFSEVDFSIVLLISVGEIAIDY